MPFNIPIPEDRSGEMIGQGLANAMLAYRQARENKTFRAEHEQDRAHMLQAQSLDDAIRQSSARQAGITPGTAPQENLDLPVYDRMPASTDHLPFDTAMQPHPEGLASALSSQFDRAGGMQPPSSAPSTPGAFSIAHGGFHSPLKDQMGGGGVAQAGAPAGGDPGFQKRPMPGTDPGFQNRPQDGPSSVLRMAPSYQQLTPEYYLDRTAPGPVGSALAAALGRDKTTAEIGELGARAKYYTEHGDYFEQGGFGGRAGANGAPHTLRTPNGYMLWDPQSRTYIPVDDENGQPVMPVLPRPSTALPAGVRNARSAASATRQDAGSFDRLAASFAKPLNDPTTRLVGDTASFPSLRDSVSKYRGKADSARAVAAGYDQQANAGTGLSTPLTPAPRASFGGVQGGGSSANAPTGATNQQNARLDVTYHDQPKYTRQQIDSLYQDAVKRGADPAKAKARRDQLMKTASQ